MNIFVLFTRFYMVVINIVVVVDDDFLSFEFVWKFFNYAKLCERFEAKAKATLLLREKTP